MQIQNMNSYLEVARKKIIEKYHSDEYNNFIEILKKSQIYKAANGFMTKSILYSNYRVK